MTQPGDREGVFCWDGSLCGSQILSFLVLEDMSPSGCLAAQQKASYHKDKLKMTTGLLSLEMARILRSPSLHLLAAKLFLGPWVTKGV